MRYFAKPLDNIRIASPCSADWNEMYGDDRKRFCGDCKLNVYNLSNMTRDEAEDIIIASEGRVCVTFYRRPDGTVIVRDCPVGLRAFRKNLTRRVTAVCSIVTSFVLGMAVVRYFAPINYLVPRITVPARPEPKPPKISFGGGISNLSEIKAAILNRD
jgi:hypothetical protein